MQDKFYVGAKVLCVETHSQGYVTKGKVYEVQGIMKRHCNCGGVLLDIGINVNAISLRCPRCGATKPKTDNICWLGERLFRLLEPDTELSEVEVNELLRHYATR